MQTEEKTAEMLTLPLDKFPHLQHTKNSIDTLKNLVELLNKRKRIIENSTEELKPYEQNERQIALIKTDIELAKVHTGIKQKEIYFKDFSNNVTTYLKEIEEKWDTLMEKARKTANNNNPDLKKLLDEADHTEFEKNWELKINHYIRVKVLVYPKKDPTGGHLKKA